VPITTKPAVRVSGLGISPVTKPTHTGLRIGSKIVIRIASREDTTGIALVYNTYGIPS
jgi:hypothetical protein